MHKTRKPVSGKVGHIVIDQRAAYELKTKLDVKIAEYIAGIDEE